MCVLGVSAAFLSARTCDMACESCVMEGNVLSRAREDFVFALEEVDENEFEEEEGGDELKEVDVEVVEEEVSPTSSPERSSPGGASDDSLGMGVAVIEFVVEGGVAVGVG